MDVTPQELRGSEIKEAWRGYHRDEVDELLERAALTIEGLSQKLATAGPRGPADAGSLAVNRDDAEILQRTLILAQRAADDAVNEAQARARTLIEESEARAQALVGEAEASARRIADTERRRLEAEIHDLASRRATLQADADALEAYAGAYRERVRAAIEADLDKLDAGVIDAPMPRPEVHDVEIPASSSNGAPGVPEPEVEPEADRGVSRGAASHAGTRAITIDAPSASAPPAAEPTPASIASPARGAGEWPPPAPPDSGTTAPAASSTWLGGNDDWSPSDSAFDDAPPWEQATAQHEPFASEVPMEAHAVDGDALDDDAFFASLRDAVRDEQPLGPVDEEPSVYIEDELADDRRRFRRRR